MVSYRIPVGNKDAMQILWLRILDKERLCQKEATLQVQGLRSQILFRWQVRWNEKR